MEKRRLMPLLGAHQSMAGGLHLAFVDGLDSAADDLGDVGAGVQRHRQRAGEEGAVRLAELARAIAANAGCAGKISPALQCATGRAGHSQRQQTA